MKTKPIVWDRDFAAMYLAERSSFVPEHILADPTIAETAFREATAMHPLHTSCEHCVRAQRARDILAGVPGAVDGELRLL